MLNRSHKRGEDLGCRGILRDSEGGELTSQRLKSVLALALKKETLLVIEPTAKVIDKLEFRKFTTIVLKENEMAVSFIQSGMLDEFQMAHIKTERALKKPFPIYRRMRPFWSWKRCWTE